MDWPQIKSALEIAALLSTILGGLSIVFAVFSFWLGKKQLHFSALDRCISSFQDKFLSLNQNSKPELVAQYVDFVNEELFYFQEGFLPKAIAIEWID